MVYGKIYRLGVAVQILHRTEQTRLACDSKAALRRAFGAVWEMISHALTILMNVANLAEIGRFASVTLRRVASAPDAVWFAIRCGCTEILFQGVETATADSEAVERPDEASLLGRIRAVLIEGITVTAPIPA